MFHPLLSIPFYTFFPASFFQKMTVLQVLRNSNKFKIGYRMNSTPKRITFQYHIRYYNRPWASNPYVNNSRNWISKMEQHPYSPFKPIRQFPESIRYIFYANTIVFLLHQLAPYFAYNNFTLKARDFYNGRFIYTSFTNLISHASLFHFLINMVMLYFFIPPILSYLTIRNFHKLYWGCGFAGATVGGIYLSRYDALLGASGSVYGILAFLAMKTPYNQIMLWGVLPMKMWQLILGVILIEGYLFSRTHNNMYRNQYGRGPVGRTSHESHLTGIAGGFAFYYILQAGWL